MPCRPRAGRGRQGIRGSPGRLRGGTTHGRVRISDRYPVISANAPRDGCPPRANAPPATRSLSRGRQGAQNSASDGSGVTEDALIHGEVTEGKRSEASVRLPSATRPPPRNPLSFVTHRVTKDNGLPPAGCPRALVPDPGPPPESSQLSAVCAAKCDLDPRNRPGPAADRRPWPARGPPISRPRRQLPPPHWPEATAAACRLDVINDRPILTSVSI